MSVSALKSVEHADSQLSEIASLLALGVMRIHKREGGISGANTSDRKSSGNPDRKGLELPAETVLSVHHG